MKISSIVLTIGVTLIAGNELLAGIGRFGCSGGPYESDRCWQVWMRPSIFGWFAVKSIGSPNAEMRNTMTRAPWIPYLVDCRAGGGTQEECESQLPKPVWGLHELARQQSLANWHTEKRFPWRPLIDTCMLNGETRRECTEKLPRAVLAKLEDWEQSMAQHRREFLNQQEGK